MNSDSKVVAKAYFAGTLFGLYVILMVLGWGLTFRDLIEYGKEHYTAPATLEIILGMSWRWLQFIAFNGGIFLTLPSVWTWMIKYAHNVAHAK